MSPAGISRNTRSRREWESLTNFSPALPPISTGADLSIRNGSLRMRQGKPVAPETGENFEVGLKWSLFNNRLVGLLSLYQLTRNNVATLDLSTPDPFDSTVTGQQRARGFELELAANPIPGLEIVLAYTFIDAEVTQDNVIPIGTPLQGVPTNSFSSLGEIYDPGGSAPRPRAGARRSLLLQPIRGHREYF